MVGSSAALPGVLTVLCCDELPVQAMSVDYARKIVWFQLGTGRVSFRGILRAATSTSRQSAADRGLFIERHRVPDSILLKARRRLAHVLARMGPTSRSVAVPSAARDRYWLRYRAWWELGRLFAWALCHSLTHSDLHVRGTIFPGAPNPFHAPTARTHVERRRLRDDHRIPIQATTLARYSTDRRSRRIHPHCRDQRHYHHHSTTRFRNRSGPPGVS
jgi:hypothetical protein